MINRCLSLLCIVGSLMFTSAFASELSQQQEADLLGLQLRWGKVNYAEDSKTKVIDFVTLAKISDKLSVRYSGLAEFHVWNGIVNSSLAGAKGGLGALKIVKKARRAFDQAIEIDGDVLNGSAHTSLGVLYYKVPGWPLGFGSDKKAEEHLQAGLRIAPYSIDANYFMADFLYHQGDKEQAKQYLLRALQAAPRPNRPLADQGRRTEIKQLLEKMS